MTKNEKKYTTCGECPTKIREGCPFYEPNANDDLCVYEFLKPQKEKEKKENISKQAQKPHFDF